MAGGKSVMVEWGEIPLCEKDDEGITGILIQSRVLPNHFTCPDSSKHRKKWLAPRKHKSTSKYRHLRKVSHQDNQWNLSLSSWMQWCEAIPSQNNTGYFVAMLPPVVIIKWQGILCSDAASCPDYQVTNILCAQTWRHGHEPRHHNFSW